MSAKGLANPNGYREETDASRGLGLNSLYTTEVFSKSCPASNSRGISGHSPSVISTGLSRTGPISPSNNTAHRARPCQLGSSWTPIRSGMRSQAQELLETVGRTKTTEFRQ